MGPDTPTAARTSPLGPRTAALTEATPGLALPDALDPPGRRSSPFAAPRPAEPRSSGSAAPIGHDRAQAVGRLERRHADPLLAVADVELHALAGLLAQRMPAPGAAAVGQRAPPRPPPGRAPMRRRPRAKRPSSSRRTRPWASRATARRWAVARESPVAATSSASDAGPGLDGAEDRHRLVEHADTAYTGSTAARSTSQYVRHKRRPEDPMAKTLSREGLGPPRRAAAAPASPTCSTSTCTSSTRSPRPRPSTASAWPGARCAGPT